MSKKPYNTFYIRLWDALAAEQCHNNGQIAEITDLIVDHVSDSVTSVDVDRDQSGEDASFQLRKLATH